MPRKKSREYCIRCFKKVHDDKYDYSKFVYNGMKVKSIFVCPIHGEFEQLPYKHIIGYGCPKCGGTYHYTTEEWIEEAKKIHPNENYDYSNVEYRSKNDKVCITCQKHGEFLQTASNHLQGSGCPKCAIEYKASLRRKTYEQFENESQQIHSNKYKYHQDYINDSTKVKITCPIHGDFWQTPSNHLQGHGCKKCQNELLSKLKNSSAEEFEAKAKIIHNNVYFYHNDYIEAKTKVKITCPIHGDFWQTPNKHLCGQGCPKCNSSKMEKEISKLLTENNIDFEEQKRFEWLGLQSLDFYVPSKNIAIECQGLQHFEANEHFGSNTELKNAQERDKRKFKLCTKHNIQILYYANYNYNFPYEVITNTDYLINKIKI